MKKLIILLMVLGVIFAGISVSQADSSRTINRKFRAFTADTDVAQSAVIYRITGKVSGSSGEFGIYNTTSTPLAALTNLAVEGGEATSGDALPMYDFGDEGLVLDTGMTVVVSSCTIVVEYI